MSTYDQLSFASNPTLYLSAPDINDKSGAGAFTLANNNLIATGQPIIYGNAKSFYINDTNTVDVIGNPLFFGTNTSLEFVSVISKPTQDVPIVVDDNNMNGIFITPTGIVLRLFFETSSASYSKIAFVRVKDWDKKLHVIVTVSNTQSVLNVNGEYSYLQYTDSIIPSDNLTIGGGYSNYAYLIDGIGFYRGTSIDKSMVINDPGSGYEIYTGRKYGSTTTKFDNPVFAYSENFVLSDFSFSTEPDMYTLIYYVSRYGEATDYISVRSNDENVVVSYVLNLDTTGDFSNYLLLDDVDTATLVFYVAAEDVQDDFKLTINAYSNGSITTNTPASLQLEGMALYDVGSESIVNYPNGTLLNQSTYTGTWIEDVPSTIEIVFKAIESTLDTIVFSSIDGQVSYGPTGSISGYTTYLNGVLVADMSDVLLNQWNHLVLVYSSPTATEFYINSDDGLSSDQTIAYMLLTSYAQELDLNQVEQLYNILSGIDVISAQEPALSIIEGEFDNGLAFNYYSYAWSIIGAGGL